MTVESHGVSPNDDELHVCVQELPQEVAEVDGEIDHAGLPRTKRHGISPRE
jgi:hypothetical protein